MNFLGSGHVSRILCVTAIAFSASPVFSQLTVTGFNHATATVAPNGAWTVSDSAHGWKFGGSIGANTTAATINTGTDNLGPYQELAFSYPISGAWRSASIRVYPARPIALFSVTYSSFSSNVSPFPTISTYPKLSHLTFSGDFAQPTFGGFAPDSPFVYFDGSANTYVVSPASDFMTAATTRTNDGSIAAGISTQIGTLPAGMTHKTVLVFGSGINATIGKWGQALTDLSGKKRPANDVDALLKSVSYWTDNGGSYYYNPGGSSYTGTLDSIASEFTAKGVRLGSLQLDSWWYPKGPTDVWSDHQGIWTYTAAPDLFPAGLVGFRKEIGVPLIAHSRWIDAQSPLRTQYAMSGNVSIDPQFWEDTADYLKAGGVTVYEQDWLNNNAGTAFNLYDPYAYLDNMAVSMGRRGINIQYCTPATSHVLQSSMYDNVTTIRDSNDRFEFDRWTDFFYSSKLTSALGAWPFTDVFMSSETNNLIAATLSAGPVGLGDSVGDISKQNLLKAARPDGVIVKPDAAASPLDSVFINDAQGIDVPMVVSSYSDFGGGLKANYIFAYTRGANTTITIDPATYGITGQSYLYDYLTGEGHFLDTRATRTLDLTYAVGYFVLVPAGKTGIALLGDKDQFVTLGKARIASFTDTGRIDVTVSFAAGETSRLLFGYSPAPVVTTPVAGSASAATWDPVSQIFTLKVSPASNGTAHVRMIQSFNPAGSGTSSIGGCGFRCGGGNR